MATSSLLGIDTDLPPAGHRSTGIDSLGPSDASDSGSDSAGAYSDEPDSDTDRFGTGERRSAEPHEPPDAQDILPDHVESLADDASAAEPDEGSGRGGSSRSATQAAIAAAEDEEDRQDEVGSDDGTPAAGG